MATTAATSPSAPTALTVMGASRSSVTLAWQPPASSGGSPVVAYEVQLQAVTRAAREVLGDDWLIIYDGPSTATTFSALHPGCTYMARVCARNAAGRGPFTIAAQVVSAPDAPAAPLIPEAEVDSTVRGAALGLGLGGLVVGGSGFGGGAGGLGQGAWLSHQLCWLACRCLHGSGAQHQSAAARS